MHLRRHIPLLIALIANNILWLILTELNHYLSIWSLYIMTPALFVLYPALNLSYRKGLLISLLTGLLQDSALPLSSNGFFTLALPTLHLITFRLRDKLHREGGLDTVLLLQVINLITLLVLTVLLSPSQLGGLSAHFLALLLQVLISQLFILVTGNYFLGLQRRLGKVFFKEVREEEAPAT